MLTNTAPLHDFFARFDTFTVQAFIIACRRFVTVARRQLRGGGSLTERLEWINRNLSSLRDCQGTARLTLRYGEETLAFDHALKMATNDVLELVGRAYLDRGDHETAILFLRKRTELLQDFMVSRRVCDEQWVGTHKPANRSHEETLFPPV